MPDDRDASDDTLLPPPGLEATIAAPATPPLSPSPSPSPSPSGAAPTIAAGTKDGASPTVPQVQRSGGATLTMLDTERYRLGELLGKGGMGEVLLAFDEQLGREVAIKRIRGEAAAGELLARFLREARVQGRLQHPAVVPVHDLAFDKNGRPYFVMKRLSGTTMADLLRDAPGADDASLRRRLLRAFVDVCLAVEFAHKSGIIHRDLKPANIMLGDFGEVYVLDWGVARAVTDADETSAAISKEMDLQLDSGETRAGSVLGTPSYMAPEQYAGERVGPAADLYALGCILYEITAGKMLHEGRRSMASIVSPPDASPSRVRPDAPPELDAICVRATMLDPTQRFDSARALGDAVQAYLDGDRDLALRREHAQRHITAARMALAQRDGEVSRRDAMREAGRALALDPSSTEAADIVSQLVLEPPAEIPAEVDARVAAIDTDTARAQGRLAAVSVLGYLGFVPLLVWTGVRDSRFLVAFAVLVVACAAQVWTLSRSASISRRGIYTSVVLNAMLIAVVARIVGPFVIAPTLVMTTLMAYGAHPRFGSIKIVAGVLAAGVAVPWLLEVLGVLSPTYRFTDAGELVLSSDVIRFSSAPVQLAFAGLLVALVPIVAVLTRGMARRQREAARKVELQAWHLRQLVPATDDRDQRPTA